MEVVLSAADAGGSHTMVSSWRIKSASEGSDDPSVESALMLHFNPGPSTC